MLHHEDIDVLEYWELLRARWRVIGRDMVRDRRFGNTPGKPGNEPLVRRPDYAPDRIRRAKDARRQ